MAKVINKDKVLAKIKARQSYYAQNNGISAVVSYGTDYGLFVHEDMEARHYPPYGTGGQAKFLEEPARLNKQKYATIVKNELKAGATVDQALMTAGLALQRDSQELCPVDKGDLKASANTRLQRKS